MKQNAPVRPGWWAAERQREPPCVWMMAGVLDYRLCDRAYECEGCELFHALTSGGPRPGRIGAPAPERSHANAPAGTANASRSWTEEQVTAHLCHLLGDCQLYLDRWYRPPHFWLLQEGNGEVRAGLAGHLLRMLRPIDRIVTPGVGLALRRGQPCGWIAHDGMAVSLAMPISGVVVEVSDAQPWLFRVEPSESLAEIAELVRGEELLLWYLDIIRTLKRYLREAIASPAGESLGATMADGGETPCLEAVLGRGRFERLLSEIV